MSLAIPGNELAGGADEAAAQEGLRELAQIAWDMRAGGIPPEHDLDTVVRDFKPAGRGPVSDRFGA